MKTCQVFVSHTLDMARFPQDKSFVQAALDAVGRAEMAAVDMRYFPANDGRPADYCRARVRSCEVYVAIIGFRYGSMVPGKTVSHTEMEYLEASFAGKPRLVFLLDESACPAGLADADLTLIREFRQRVADADLVIRYFTSSLDLELEIFHALSQLTHRRPVRAQRPSLRLTGVASHWHEPEVARGVITLSPEYFPQVPGSGPELAAELPRPDPVLPRTDRPDVIVMPKARKYRRYQLVAAIMAAVVVLAVVTGVGVRALIDRHQPGHQRPPAVRAQAGPRPWEHTTSDSVDGSPTVAGDVVYVADDHGVVYAFTAASGRELWTYQTHAQIDSQPFIARGVLYIGNDAGNFYAIYIAHGTIDWMRHFGYGIDSSATVIDGIVYFGDNDDHVDALRAATGHTVWRHHTNGNVQSSPVVRDGTVYVGCGDGYIYALSTRDGKVIWKRKTGGQVESSPVLAGGYLYIGSDDHDLYALRTGTAAGHPAWVRPTGGAITAAPLVYRNVIYVGSENGTLYAFNARTGLRLREYVLGGVIDSTPYVYRGIIYIGNSVNPNSGSLYAITTSGRTIWRHQTGGEVNSSPVVAEGLVYVGTDNDAALAYRLADG